MRLSPEARRRKILAELGERGGSVRGLAGATGVSEITIRRDLEALRREGKLLRVYGGALATERVAFEFSFKEKEAQRREEKEAIGRLAAELVEEGATVFVDTGTTALAAARALRGRKAGVIVTINLCVASEYVGQRETRVLVPGGEVGHLSPDLLGEWTLKNLSDVHVDLAFLGCDGVVLEEGFFAADVKTAAISQLMLQRAARRCLLADSAKFGQRSMCRIAGLEALTDVVTDKGLEPKHRRAVERMGLGLFMA